MLGVADTIAALASAPGSAPRGILRISGPAAASCWRAVVELPADATTPSPGDAPDDHAAQAASPPRLLAGRLRLPPPWPVIDCLVAWWPGRRSYTREPTAELHLPGSPPLLEAALAEVCRAGARLAAPGEFTLRAFLAGRLDLTQAEAVLGVIDARSHRELDRALEQLAGGLAAPLRRLRSQLLELLAQLEAGLDFVEEDIEFVSADSVAATVSSALDDLIQLRDRLTERGSIAGGPRVALVGLPNVGKSSLFNALVGSTAALVAPLPGTTRDYVEREICVGGRQIRLVDAAGLEPQRALSGVAAEAQIVARQQHAQASLRLVCLDASRPWTADEQEWATAAAADTLVVLTKSDLPSGLPEAAALRAAGAMAVSSRTGAGLAELHDALSQRLAQLEDAEIGVVQGTAARCHDSLVRAQSALQAARELARHHGGEELIAAELRLALDELGQIAGAVYTDDLLDVIFSRFCIGK